MIRDVLAAYTDAEPGGIIAVIQPIIVVRALLTVDSLNVVYDESTIMGGDMAPSSNSLPIAMTMPQNDMYLLIRGSRPITAFVALFIASSMLKPFLLT